MHVMSQLHVLHLKDNDFGPTMVEVRAQASVLFFICFHAFDLFFVSLLNVQLKSVGSKLCDDRS